MATFEIYWSDLTEKAKADLIENGFNAHGNIDIMPICVIEQEDFED